MTKWSRWISAKRTQLRHFVTICLHVTGFYTVCNISYLSDSQDHIHDSERDHETAIKRLCKRSRPLSGLPYLVSSDRYHLNEYFIRLSSPGWIFRVSLLHAPGKREREALGTSLSLFLQPERNGDASDQKRICPIIFSSRDTNYRDVLYLLENIISPLQR